ncbi:crispr-associated protein [Leptolyngbya sp. Heron Island J]|uniref:type III-B CRISPR module-associated Cmr3 family protein n=1 Tax=Leptolyngbya sp. Heron Island J TaxID=1385935 RepID=UPI0003B99E88|nr:type III-B CRISPR module-associated Cmr3 family protein [Leptolyngbya sp. Heron Island J]ESA33440.1 crispr-associated protein [Leptolyngbya sp. Heron Island J]
MLKYLITVKPLGLLYGSSGRFLSPENLVGRSGSHFPPSAATVSGLFAYHYSSTQSDELRDLQVAGPFWGWQSNPQDFCVPAPMSLLAKFKPNLEKTQIPEAVVEDRLAWHSDTDIQWRNSSNEAPDKKFSSGAWIKLSDWETISTGNVEASKAVATYGEPWQFAPHLHPYLLKDQRKVDTDRERGSLFLENSVQLHPEACLVYLSNLKLTDGWYRFGGEGHMVEITCDDLGNTAKTLLDTKIERSFALITPAIWGSNRLSYRYPQELKKGDKQRHELDDVDSDLSTQWQVDGLLTKRPSPFRYRLGDAKSALDETGKPKRSQPPKRLSRGRYAMPAGSVYVLKTAFPENHNTWQKWPEAWFPQEGPSLKRWGCGLALPLESAIAN